MSLIIGIKQKDTIYLGADTQLTMGSTKKNQIINKENYKIRKFPNDILVGSVGSFQTDLILYTNTEWFLDIPKDGLTKKYLVTKIVPKFYNILKEKKLLNESGNMESSFIFVWKDRFYYLLDNFTVISLSNFILIGSGESFATPSLYCNKPIREKILNGLDSASCFSTTVSAPYILIDSKHLEYEIVRGGKNDCSM